MLKRRIFDKKKWKFNWSFEEFMMIYFIIVGMPNGASIILHNKEKIHEERKEAKEKYFSKK